MPEPKKSNRWTNWSGRSLSPRWETGHRYPTHTTTEARLNLSGNIDPLIPCSVIVAARKGHFPAMLPASVTRKTKPTPVISQRLPRTTAGQVCHKCFFTATDSGNGRFPTPCEKAQ